VSERFICDCGQVYSERAAVRECQAARHSAAAGCELADAETTLRRAGLPLAEDGPLEPVRARPKLRPLRPGEYYCIFPKGGEMPHIVRTPGPFFESNAEAAGRRVGIVRLMEVLDDVQSTTTAVPVAS
jgi:hypothetical protein